MSTLKKILLKGLLVFWFLLGVIVLSLSIHALGSANKYIYCVYGSACVRFTVYSDGSYEMSRTNIQKLTLAFNETGEKWIRGQESNLNMAIVLYLNSNTGKLWPAAPASKRENLFDWGKLPPGIDCNSIDSAQGEYDIYYSRDDGLTLLFVPKEWGKDIFQFQYLQCIKP